MEPRRRDVRNRNDAVSEMGEAKRHEDYLRRSAADDDQDVFESTWVLVAGQPFQDAAFKAAGVKAQAGRTIRTWTDEYSNLFQVLR